MDYKKEFEGFDESEHNQDFVSYAQGFLDGINSFLNQKSNEESEPKDLFVWMLEGIKNGQNESKAKKEAESLIVQKANELEQRLESEKRKREAVIKERVEMIRIVLTLIDAIRGLGFKIDGDIEELYQKNKKAIEDVDKFGVYALMD